MLTDALDLTPEQQAPGRTPRAGTMPKPPSGDAGRELLRGAQEQLAGDLQHTDDQRAKFLGPAR